MLESCEDRARGDAHHHRGNVSVTGRASQRASVTLDGRLTCLLTLAKGETEALAHMHFYPRNSPTTPTMDAATPPTSIHIALSVGEPVKKRAMSELNELAALTPKMSSRMPP